MKPLLRRLGQTFGRITLHGTYRPEIDGLRFIAIALVLFGHLMERTERAVGLHRPLSGAEQDLAFWIPKATTGVLLFFTISGYILGMQFHRQQQKGQRFRYFPYLLRRASRIAPPYYLVLFAGFLALTVVGFHPQLMDRGEAGIDLGRSLLFSLAFVHGAVLGQLPQAFPPGWSLEVEVQFYVVAPVLFAAMMRARAAAHPGWKWLVMAIAVLAMALSTQVLGQRGGYYLSLLRFLPYFMLGPLLVLTLAPGAADRSPLETRLADIVGFLALTLLGLTGVAQPLVEGWLPVSLLDVVRLAAIAGMFAGAVQGRYFKAMCSLRVVSVLGGACFSLYLCHLQVMQVMTPLLARLLPSASLGTSYLVSCLVQLPLVVVVSMVFYLAVERPFMRGIDWSALLRRRKPAPA